MTVPSADPRRARQIATGMVAAIGALWAARILAASTGSLTDQDSLAVSLAYDVGAIVFSGVFAAVGWAIVTRQPRNTIGWLLLAIPLIGILAFVVGDYATEALAMHPGSLPFGRAAAWFDRWLIVVVLAIFIPVFLLFPDGKVPSRRWRPVLWLTIAASTITVLSFALTPGRLTGAFANLEDVVVTNPLGLDAFRGPLAALTLVGGFATLASAFLAGAAIVVRFKGASGDVRQQIKWLAFVGVAFLAELVLGVALSIVLGDSDTLGNVIFGVWFVTLFAGIPLACGVAILKYRLYELDVVIRKTVVFGLLAAFIGVVYGVIVGGLGALVGSHSSTFLSFVAAAVLAVVFQPARDRARRLADHLAYGKRATPYEVLAEFSGRVGEAYDSDDVLERMASILREGTGAVRATVSVRIAGDLRPIATVPAGPPATETSIPVQHGGDELGALQVDMPPSDPINPAKRRLVEDLAAQAGLVLRNVRLIEELRDSRRRIVAAQDERAKQLERNIHDGAQQQLVALAVKARLARTLGERDPAKSNELLEQIESDLSTALEDLRQLARGIYPPLLADKGLAAALEAQARRSPVPVRVEHGAVGRFSRDTEAAAYFSCLEALQNVAKYARASAVTIRLSDGAGELRFEIDDDGVGFDPASTGYGTGLQGIRDRLDALGGSLEVRSAPGTGTRVVGRIPAHAADA